METVESLDFKHSSRQAWRLIKRLEPEGPERRRKPPIEADTVARDILNRSQRIPDKVFERRVRKEYARIWDGLSDEDSSTWTRPFSPAEVAEALSCVKNGKATGIDGIYPDMLTHLGGEARC